MSKFPLSELSVHQTFINRCNIELCLRHWHWKRISPVDVKFIEDNLTICDHKFTLEEGKIDSDEGWLYDYKVIFKPI